MLTTVLNVFILLGPHAVSVMPTSYGAFPHQAQLSEPVTLDDAIQSGATLDPVEVFERLVDRYRGLTAYADTSRIVQIIRYSGEDEPHRIETEVGCRIEGDALTVQSAASQIRDQFGLRLPIRHSEQMKDADLRYQLWMLPHLVLRFSDAPLAELREGVPGGFIASDASPVKVKNRSMVHLELTNRRTSRPGNDAVFDFYVDPDSMLIERIHGRQQLPGGGSYETTVEIRPTYVRSDQPDAGASRHVESPSTPTGSPAGTAPPPWDDEEFVGPPRAQPSDPASDEPHPSEDPEEKDPSPAPLPRGDEPSDSGQMQAPPRW